MADWEFDYSEFQDISKELQKHITPVAVYKVEKKAVNKLAAQYLRSAKKHTPVGENQKREISQDTAEKIKSGVRGKKKFYIVSNSEHMKRSWGVTPARGDHKGVVATVFNSASYASYVNDGHRQEAGRYVPLLGKRLVKNFVKGLHMNETAHKETTAKSYRIVDKEIQKLLKELFHV